MSAEATLAERLGYSREARLLIINCDDLGVTLGMSTAILDALHAGRATSASLMVPCPWAQHAAVHAMASDDIGVHLTLTSERPGYGWGPVSDASLLRRIDGRFLADDEGVHALVLAAGRAGLDAIRRECSAQVQVALGWGVDVSHLDAHMGVLQAQDEFLTNYIELAAEFGLPVRMISASVEARLGLHGRSRAAALGVLHPDQMVSTYLGARPVIERAIASLRPGVTEVLLHPSVDTAELRAVFADADERVANLHFLMGPTSLADQASEHGITLIGFRALRDLQRDEARDRERSTAAAPAIARVPPIPMQMPMPIPADPDPEPDAGPDPDPELDAGPDPDPEPDAGQCGRRRDPCPADEPPRGHRKEHS